MPEHNHTADLAISYQPIPRVNERLLMGPDSYVDLMLPNNASSRSRLRLHDVNDRWLRVLDLSDSDGYIPGALETADYPYGAFDAFALDEPFAVGRHHNPDNLPILNKDVISRSHFNLTVSLGERGIILAIHDISSHNGTELILNDTVTKLTDETSVSPPIVTF